MVIGTGAFAFCESLKEITLPKGIIAIGADVFDGCRKLKKIYIPSGTADIYKEALPEKQHRLLKEV